MYDVLFMMFIRKLRRSGIMVENIDKINLKAPEERDYFFARQGAAAQRKSRSYRRLGEGEVEMGQL